MSYMGNNNIIKKSKSFISKYYLIFIGLYFLEQAIMQINSNTSIDYKAYLFILAFASFTAMSEIRNDIKLIPYLLIAVPFILFIFYISNHGYEFWGKMLSWQISRGMVIDLNPIFKKIPFNDASFARIYQNETLTWFFRLVYNNGFVLPVLIPLYRAGMAKDFKKMLRYALSGHVLQVFLITPFYLLFHLQEVWYVTNQPDGLARHLSSQAAAGVTLNCFPSMHTSIAFAMFLLVLREKNKPFKYVWAFFCLCVIYSTMYLEIHWVIDVIAGIILAACSVKLVDFLLAHGEKLIQKPLNMFYYKQKKTTTINNYYFN
jgi:membrane-associated phospholipid phosphatase